MREITSRSAPYSSIVYLESIFPDGSAFRGSGSVVGNNDVLTANHMVYNAAHGGSAVQVMVAPGAFVNDATGAWSAPLGTYLANNWSSRVGNWDANGDGLVSPSEAQNDLTLLGFNVNRHPHAHAGRRHFLHWHRARLSGSRHRSHGRHRHGDPV